MQKIELVITNNIILSDEIKTLGTNYTDINIQTKYVTNIDVEKYLMNYKKIDLLIIDYIIKPEQLKYLIKISKTIVNMIESAATSNNYINLIKPFRVKDLFDIISKSRHSHFIYEMIWQDLLFNEEESVISNISSGENIVLTEKETSLIAGLFLAKNYSMTKEEILQNIWGYSTNIETATLETHISRLRNKLPSNLINNKEGNISLSYYGNNKF